MKAHSERVAAEAIEEQQHIDLHLDEANDVEASESSTRGDV